VRELIMDFDIKILVALLIAVIAFGQSDPCFGDGKAFSGYDFSSLYPILEDEQRAVILHRNGIEKMLIAVSLELEEEDDAVWIFPLPGEPNKVKLDIVDSFPRFWGVDPREEARSLFSSIRDVALFTQIYTVPIIGCLFSGLGGVAGIDLPTIHAEIDKWGIHAEAVTAESIEGLSNYLKNKKVGIETKELIAFEDYLSEKHVLVIVWISSRKKLLEEFPDYGERDKLHEGRWPCLYVEFVTDRAFYPLRPTSSYGGERIPIYLTVIDYVKLDTTVDFAEKFSTEYYKQETLPEGTPTELAKDLRQSEIAYTSIRFEDRAEELTEDLWFAPAEPKGMKYAENLLSLFKNMYVSFIFMICFILVVSYISAGLAGLVLFRKWSGYARLGLWNVLTLFGLYLATCYVKGPAGERLRDSERNPSRPVFMVVFSFFFVVFTFLLISAISAPL
jgi:hypothetical protein